MQRENHARVQVKFSDGLKALQNALMRCRLKCFNLVIGHADPLRYPA